MNLVGIGTAGLAYAISAIVLGVLMLVKPRIAAYLVGAYFLFMGVMFLVLAYNP